MKLENKVAIITGGASGIGRAIALRYAEEGARCVVADIQRDKADDLAAEISDAGGAALSVGLDVTEEPEIANLVGATLDRFGCIDVLVNNAAIFEMQPLLDVTRESWDRIFDINVKGMFFVLQAVARQMVAQGEGGKIVNLASQAGRRGEALVVQYCASKAAVISITQSAGLALAKDRINVNAIAPGVVDTPMWDVVDGLFARFEGLDVGEKKRLVGEAVPYGRMGTPEDMVGAAVFLASSDADYILAQTLERGRRQLDELDRKCGGVRMCRRRFRSRGAFV